ncbi:MAG: sigma-70 family RNA polymerase sigma factor [Clostridiaceae bacterium]
MDAITDLLLHNPEQGLSQMLGAYTGLVYHAASAVLGRQSREEIEECVSDAFLAVYQRRNALDFTKGSVKAYLCATARNLAIDRLNRRARSAAEPLDEFAASPEQTDAAALANLEKNELIRRVKSLGEPDSTILICRYYFNMRTKEIARKVGLKENAVDQRLRRALIKLKHAEQGGY